MIEQNEKVVNETHRLRYGLSLWTDPLHNVISLGLSHGRRSYYKEMAKCQDGGYQ